jgi:hypothetical protein
VEIFAIVSFVLLAGQYVLALLTSSTDQSKTPVVDWDFSGIRRKKSKDGEVTEESVGRKVVTLDFRELTETEKRRRFMWFALTSLPAMLFLLIYLLQ